MVQSEAQKRAKAKYYQKIKNDPNYKEKMTMNSKKFYEENKEKQIEKSKKYYNENKEIISEKVKEKRNKDKLNDVLTKLELIDKEQLAKLLIESKKSNLLDEYFLNIKFLTKFTYFILRIIK